MVRFNHSCCPNAETYWNDISKLREIRAVTKIKAGEEISITYEKSTAMHGKKSRQNYFKENWGFLCKCEICEDDEEDENQEIVQKFEELKVKAQEMQEIADESATLQGEPNQSWLISKLLITLIFTILKCSQKCTFSELCPF